MKKTAIRVAIGLVVVLVLFAVIGMLLPRKVHLERSIDVAAPASVVFDLVDDLRRWPDWTPWNKEADPSLEFTFEGDRGEGTSYSWKGDEFGTGRLTITKSTPQQGVECEMYFNGEDLPSYSSIQLSPDGDVTTVVWTFDGDMGASPVGRYFGLMMESLLGPDYEKGLSNLKTIAESESASQKASSEPGEIDSPEEPPT